MSGIIEKHENKLFSINGMTDHVHIFISINPKQAPSDLMYHVNEVYHCGLMINSFVRAGSHGKKVSGLFLMEYHKFQ